MRESKECWKKMGFSLYKLTIRGLLFMFESFKKSRVRATKDEMRIGGE